jgi:hypothetical protein
MPADTTLSKSLDGLATGADVVAGLLPAGAGRTVAQIVRAALAFAADLAETGADPVAVIERLHDADPLLRGVQARWQQRISRRPGAPR